MLGKLSGWHCINSNKYFLEILIISSKTCLAIKFYKEQVRFFFPDNPSLASFGIFLHNITERVMHLPYCTFEMTFGATNGRNLPNAIEHNVI